MTRFINILSASVLGLAVLLVSLQILVRATFNAPLAWAEEVGRYLFVWSVFLGAATAVIEGRHIRITALTQRWGSKGELFSRTLGHVLGLFSFGFVAYFGYKLALSNWGTGFYTIPEIPRILFYLAVPISLTIMTVYLAGILLRMGFGKKDNS